MKKLLTGAIILTLIGTIGVNLLYGESIFKKAGQAIEKGASDVGKAVSKGASTVASKTKACTEMTALGTEWAAKKAAYSTAEAALSVAQAGVNTAKGAVTASLDAAKAATGATAKLLTLSSTAINKGINITKLYFSGNLKDVTKGKLPEFQIEGTIFGKQIKTTLQLDLGDPKTAIKNLIDKVF